MHDIVTIGSTTRDAFYSVRFPTIPWPKTPSGRAYALPLGTKLEVDDIYYTIGGNAANASVTFARQGFRVAAVGKIGCDMAGDGVLQKLRAEGVKTNLVVCTPDRATAYSVLLLQNGERTIMDYHGSSDTFTMRDVRLGTLRAKWWYLSLSGESDRMFLPLMRFARTNGISVAFNPSGHHLRHRRNDILHALKDISFLTLNDEEAALLTGIPWKREKEVFRKLDALMSPGILAVTTGPTGVTVSDGKNVYKAGTFKEKKLADRTGAGDAFGSGFTAGLMRRCQVSLRRASFAEVATKAEQGFGGQAGVRCQDLSKEDICYAIRLATANATSVVEHVGATEGTLTKKEFNAPRWKKLKVEVRSI